MINVLQRESYETRELWLIGREKGIGASDAAAILGLSPWKSNLQLWLEKTGQRTTAEITGNEAIDLGNRLEPNVRQIFKAKHFNDLHVAYYPYDILYQSERPWLRATLDGEITEIATGRRGIYEGKTATCIKRSDWGKWQNGIPQNYLVQCLWQMLATDAEFVYLVAFLMNKEGDRCEYREYLLEREEHLEDLNFVLEEGQKFWKYVETKQMPPMVLK